MKIHLICPVCPPAGLITRQNTAMQSTLWRVNGNEAEMVEFTIQEAATIRLFHALKRSNNMRVTLLNIMKSEYFQDESPETK